MTRDDERTELDETEHQGTAPEAPATERAVASAVGRFRIDERIGSGGMADVFRAYDPLLDRTVALKVLHTEGLTDEAQQRRRILREARAAAALTHPNTVVIYDVGEADGLVFIAMELLDGQVLRRAIERDVPLEQKLRWLLDAARALDAAHARGLVHRDVKPENMFVCKGGLLKILDFGIAKRDDDEGVGPGGAESPLGPSSLRTAAGVRVGTPRYMAPEQKAGAPTDGRTDQYAWALVAFELLTGDNAKSSFATVKLQDGRTQDEAAAVADSRLARLRQVQGLPDDIARAIVRALSDRKEDRFEAFTPVVALLEDALTPSSAATTPHADANEDLPRTRRGRRLGAAFAALALLAGGAGALLYAQRLRASNNHEEAPRPSRPAGPPACTLGATRAYPGDRNDRFALVEGTLVVARSAGLSGDAMNKRYERESGGSLVAFAPWRGTRGDDLDEATFKAETGAIYGGVVEGRKALLLHGSRLLFIQWLDGGSKMGKRLPQPLESVATTSFRDSMVIAFTGVQTEPAGREGLANWLGKGWLGLSRVAPDAQRHDFAIDLDEPALSPAIAATNERIGLAFSRGGGSITFTWADERGAFVGDQLTVARVDARPAVAFVGEAPVVLWADRRSGSRRLAATILPPGSTKFAAPIVVDEDPVADYRPVTARLPNGAFAALWVAAPDGRPTLRAATVRAGGTLSAPVDVATGAFDLLTTSSTATGLDVAWFDEGRHLIRVASVTCAP